jgi:DNA mismatch repair ATPase MutS
MKYLAKYDNVDLILTTHYVSVCTKLRKDKRVANYKMDVVVEKDSGDLTYTYKMKRGISKIEGGMRILESMDYPKEILDSIREDSLAKG